MQCPAHSATAPSPPRRAELAAAQSTPTCDCVGQRRRRYGNDNVDKQLSRPTTVLGGPCDLLLASPLRTACPCLRYACNPGSGSGAGLLRCRLIKQILPLSVSYWFGFQVSSESMTSRPAAPPALGILAGSLGHCRGSSSSVDARDLNLRRRGGYRRPVSEWGPQQPSRLQELQALALSELACNARLMQSSTSASSSCEFGQDTAQVNSVPWIFLFLHTAQALNDRQSARLLIIMRRGA